MGGPDLFLSSTYDNHNMNNWTMWRGSDNLVYVQTVVGNGLPGPDQIQVVTKPWADCNPWQTSDGSCAMCTNASNQPLYDCCSCANPNIANLVHYEVPGSDSSVNVCQAFGITFDSTGKCVQGTPS
jgi:hypothetical protein